MNIQAIAFYILSITTVVSALNVVAGRNPVHSVLYLVLSFFSAAGLFVLLGAEFLAMLLIVVYVGAVAVLFLFVVMMLDIDFGRLREGFVRYLPLGGVVAVWIMILMGLVAWAVSDAGAAKGAAGPDVALDAPNTEQIGRVLYTDYIYFFQAAGLVLLVAMIGAIVLTLRHRPGVKRQSVMDQVARTPAKGMSIVKVETGKGISE